MDATNAAAPAGTRLRCAPCGTEIVVVKPATGPLTCCGRPMGDLADGKADKVGKVGETGEAGDAEPAR